MYKPTIQWWLEHRNSSAKNKINSHDMLDKLIEFEKKFPNDLYGIRNKNTNKFITVGELDKDFKNDNFVDVLTDEEIKEYFVRII